MRWIVILLALWPDLAYAAEQTATIVVKAGMKEKFPGSDK